MNTSERLPLFEAAHVPSSEFASTHPRLVITFHPKGEYYAVEDLYGREFRAPDEKSVAQCWKTHCGTNMELFRSIPSGSSTMVLKIHVDPDSTPDDREHFCERLSGYCWLV